MNELSLGVLIQYANSFLDHLYMDQSAPDLNAPKEYLEEILETKKQLLLLLDTYDSVMSQPVSEALDKLKKINT